MTDAAAGPLPPLQNAWMTELLGGPLPDETNATCLDCAMSGAKAGLESFHPRTKCCTYLPRLPNFLVGRALADLGPLAAAGRASVGARLAAGVGVTPLGIDRPRTYALLYEHGATESFGHSLAMRCPHYIEEGGLCGIWQHRNAICSTWFCKHLRGEVGQSFWQATEQLLSLIEAELARYCVLEIGIGAEALAALFPYQQNAAQAVSLRPEEIDGLPDPADKLLWGSWFGREAQFYEACAELVGKMSLGEILQQSGQEVRVRVELVRLAWQRLTDTSMRSPERLRVKHLKVYGGEKSCCVSTYRGTDPVSMPRTLFNELHRFDGRPTDEARDAIVAAGGPRLSASLVRKLVDFGILVPDTEDPKKLWR